MRTDLAEMRTIAAAIRLKTSSDTIRLNIATDIELCSIKY